MRLTRPVDNPQTYLYRFPSQNLSNEGDGASRTTSRKYLALSKDFNKGLGIRLQRKVRMSIDKLYDQATFSYIKNQESTKHSSSTTTMADPWSPRNQKISRRSGNSIESSQVSLAQPFKTQKLKSRGQDIKSIYYAQQRQITKGYINEYGGGSEYGVQHGRVKQYDIRGLIRYQ